MLHVVHVVDVAYANFFLELFLLVDGVLVEPKIIRRRMAPCDVLTNCSLGAFFQVQKDNIQAY